jgi:hypothetical protein
VGEAASNARRDRARLDLGRNAPGAAHGPATIASHGPSGRNLCHPSPVDRPDCARSIARLRRACARTASRLPLCSASRISVRDRCLDDAGGAGTFVRCALVGRGSPVLFSTSSVTCSATSWRTSGRCRVWSSSTPRRPRPRPGRADRRGVRELGLPDDWRSIARHPGVPRSSGRIRSSTPRHHRAAEVKTPGRCGCSG